MTNWQLHTSNYFTLSDTQIFVLQSLLTFFEPVILSCHLSKLTFLGELHKNYLEKSQQAQGKQIQITTKLTRYYFSWENTLTIIFPQKTPFN